MSTNISFRKILVFLVSLSFFIVSLYILHVDPFDSVSYLKYVVSTILFGSGLIIILQEVVYSINDLIKNQFDLLINEIELVKNDVRSTVKTLTFFQGSNGERTYVKVTSDPKKKIRNVSKGNVKLTVIPNFLDDISTTLMVEGSAESKMIKHKHKQIVSSFLIEGKITQKTKNEQIVMNKSDVVTVDPDVEREVYFNKDSIAIFVYTPSLEDWSEENTRFMPAKNPNGERLKSLKNSEERGGN